MMTNRSEQFSLCDCSEDGYNSEEDGQVNGTQCHVYEANWSDPSHFTLSDPELFSQIGELASPSSKAPVSGSQKLEVLTASIDSLRIAFETSALHAEVIESQIAVHIQEALNQIVPCVIDELKLELRNVMQEFHGNYKSSMKDGVTATGTSNLSLDNTGRKELHRHLDGVSEIKKVLVGDSDVLNPKIRELSWAGQEEIRRTVSDESSPPCDIVVPPARSLVLMALQGHWRNSSGILYVVQGSTAYASLPSGLIAVTPLLDDGNCVSWSGRWLVSSGGMYSRSPTKVQWEPINSCDESVIWWRDLEKHNDWKGELASSSSVGPSLSLPTLRSYRQDQEFCCDEQRRDARGVGDKCSQEEISASDFADDRSERQDNALSEKCSTVLESSVVGSLNRLRASSQIMRASVLAQSDQLLGQWAQMKALVDTQTAEGEK